MYLEIKLVALQCLVHRQYCHIDRDICICFLTPTAAEPPTGLNVEPVSPTSIRVSWTAPLSRATVTGYQIYYRADGDWESVAVDANITNYTLSNLQNGLTYNITMVALSIHLPSSVVGPQTLGNPLFSFFLCDCALLGIKYPWFGDI